MRARPRRGCRRQTRGRNFGRPTVRPRHSGGLRRGQRTPSVAVVWCGQQILVNQALRNKEIEREWGQNRVFLYFYGSNRAWITALRLFSNTRPSPEIQDGKQSISVLCRTFCKLSIPSDIVV
uniref:(northern house mosquito) hypothetical protein n=1 Tax=Culex pipiens TaxID=7175 RepID=A0A8D8CX05_CULPI